MPSAAFFDIDGTLTSANVWRGLMDYFTTRRERRLTHLAFIAVHYPLAFLRPLGLVSEATFRRTWGGHLPWYFRGYDASAMQRLAEWVARERVAQVTREDVLDVLRRHQAAGDVVVLVSGAPQELVAAIASMWRVDHGIGSPAEMRAGRYTGRLAGPPCIDEQMATYARRYISERGLNVDLSASYAYADSFADMGLFNMVGHPVAIYPDKKLASHAATHGWPTLPNKNL